MHILVIEDDGEAAAYLTTTLTESGHRVEAAANGRTGLEIARGDSFDVLVVDRHIRDADVVSKLVLPRKLLEEAIEVSIARAKRGGADPAWTDRAVDVTRSESR